MSEIERIVIHIGLPKCASTSMQFWFYENRDLLRNSGIEYPEPTQDTIAPKHQDLVTDFLEGRSDSISRYISECDQPILLLSKEGLSNHLFDFEKKVLDDFKFRTKGISVDLILVTREPHSWIKSWWAQTIINNRIPKYLYGSSLTEDEFAEHPRTIRYLDHPNLVEYAKEAYGAREVVISSPSTVQTDFASILGISVQSFSNMRHLHSRPLPEVLEFVRQVNGLGLTFSERRIALGALENLRPSEHNQLMEMRSEYLNGSADKVKVIEALIDNLQAKNQAQQELFWELCNLKKQ